MSSASRIGELSGAVERELAAVPDQHRRLLWLSNHLVEYVDRLQGFSRLPSVEMDALMQSDFLVMVEIAASRLEQEVSPSPHLALPRARYASVAEALQTLRREPHPRLVEVLVERVKELHHAVNGA